MDIILTVKMASLDSLYHFDKRFDSFIDRCKGAIVVKHEWFASAIGSNVYTIKNVDEWPDELDDAFSLFLGKQLLGTDCRIFTSFQRTSGFGEDRPNYNVE